MERISSRWPVSLAREKQHIAVIPMGYYDGLHRHYSRIGKVLIKGQIAPIVGDICMDFTMVDVSHITDVTIRDEVLIFGEDKNGNILPIEQFAKDGSTISHELIRCLRPRIKRMFIHPELTRRNHESITKAL